MVTIIYGDNRFSFEGKAKRIPYKFGNNRKVSTTGKIRERTISTKGSIELTISDLNEDLFKKLINCWGSTELKQIITEKGTIHTVLFPPDLPNEYNFTIDGMIFYNATLSLAEAY